MSQSDSIYQDIDFPQPFTHPHPPIQNVNKKFDNQSTFGERASDAIVNTMGSWLFIIIQSIILSVWIILNIVAWIKHWDPYPFILMNLVLSTQAAYAAPIIMMSQNRQSAKDRLEAHNDFLINQKSEEEIRAILEHLAAQDQALAQIHELLVKLDSQAELTPPNTP